MKKILLGIGLLLSTSLVAESYRIGLDKKHYEGRYSIGTYTKPDKTEPSEPALPTGTLPVCSIHFENMWTTGGQYGSPLIGQLKVKLADGSYFDFQTTSSITTKADFIGGVLTGSSYGGSLWHMGRMLTLTSTSIYPYQLFSTGKTSSSNTTSARLVFDEEQQIKGISYIDHYDIRWMDNYDIVIRDCSNNVVFSVSYTERQSPASNVSHVIDF